MQNYARAFPDMYRELYQLYVDLSGRLDRRAYPLLLSTPPA